MDVSPHDIQQKFRDLFGAEPLVVRAPGRINLIGEHTDYNDGFVMPAAVNKEIFFAIGASADTRSILYSVRYDEQFEVDLSKPMPVDEPKWANYLLGVLYQLKELGHHVKPFRCVFGGNVPLGAGMSSSAAMESGFVYAVNELNKLGIEKLKMVSIAQWSEHHFAGVKCGIMDQYASMMGKKGNVIVLDCRSLAARYAPLDLKDYGIVLCDTNVKHSLVSSEYNTRRQECESGVATLQKHYRDVASLRDVTTAMLEKHRGEFQGKVYQRCLYVVQETARVQEAASDLQQGNLKAFGSKMFQTHNGLSDLYEVSCGELDFLVAEAEKYEGVIGARMMGGGFGGCTINLVKHEATTSFISALTRRYNAAFGIDLQTYQVEVVDGVGVAGL